MKTAKVTGVLSVREWMGQNGTIYFHKIELDNGDVGDIGKKVSGGVKVGDFLNYTIETTEHGNRIKQVQQPGYGGQGNGFRGSNKAQGASFVLAYSKDVTVALIPYHPEKTPTDWVNVTIAMADKFLAWMKENEA